MSHMVHVSIYKTKTYFFLTERVAANTIWASMVIVMVIGPV